jgi:hypothetical protein
MADELRSCSRAGCRWPAAASLSYRYATRQVWLLDLSPERDPNLWELCPHHAETLTVPRGWDRVDERSIHPVIHEPAGRDLPGAAFVHAVGDAPEAPEPPRNRYEALFRELPRLAAELAGEASGPPAPPMPSRELAPGLPPDVAPSEPVPASELEPVLELEDSGQLAIPAGDVGDDEEAVVVSIELAGARRRPAEGLNP